MQGRGMKPEKQKIEPLKKVEILVSAGKRPAGKELMEPEQVCFIYGIGKSGLTPLERKIEGRCEGENLSLEISKSSVPEFFGHIFPFPLRLKIDLDPFHLNLMIKSVTSAKSREVVSALAEITSCASCDCGCGGHF
jgi:hypothetical protein